MFELERALDMLPEVETVSVPESAWTDDEKLFLAEQYPDVEVHEVEPVEELREAFRGARGDEGRVVLPLVGGDFGADA